MYARREEVVREETMRVLVHSDKRRQVASGVDVEEEGEEVMREETTRVLASGDKRRQFASGSRCV